MNEQQWHEWRRQGIGASDIGVLMGYSNYATPLDLYQIKVGERQPEPSGDLAKLGQDNERKILEWFEEKTKIKLAKTIFKENGFIRASLDGWNEEKRIPVDAKFSSSDGWGDQDKEEVPMHIFFQMHWQMHVTDASTSYVVKRDRLTGVYVDPYEIKRNKVLETQIERVASNFWHNHVLKKVPPKNALYGTLEMQEKIERLRAIAEAIKPLKKEKDLLSDEVKEFMHNYEFLIFPDIKKPTKYTTTKKQSFDENRFKLENKSLYEQYVTETTTRRFYA